jgi:hypothetical protein
LQPAAAGENEPPQLKRLAFGVQQGDESMPPSSSLNEDIKQHYTRPDLGTVILAALASMGKDLDALKPEDLAPIDEFHIRGRQATLVTPDELRQLLEASGFKIASWEDTTTAAREWFTALAKKIQQHGLPPLGLHLLMGSDFQVMAENQRRNLEEGHIVLGQVAGRK